MADFGFAKHVGGDKTYTICGTPDYQVRAVPGAERCGALGLCEMEGVPARGGTPPGGRAPGRQGRGREWWQDQPNTMLRQRACSTPFFTSAQPTHAPEAIMRQYALPTHSFAFPTHTGA
eukprot:352790-Chlamydomonas_euryale.AAC.2